MIAIPFSIALLMIGLILLQNNHYLFMERYKELADSAITNGEMEKLKKEFTEYKKRVDGLSLKVGFKI